MTGHPCQPRVIIGSFSSARMRALSESSKFDIFLSLTPREMMCGSVLVRFSKKEFDILLAIASKVGGIVSIETIIDFLYGWDPNGGPETADNVIFVLIRKIRIKIKVFQYISIRNMWGYGFYLFFAPQYAQEAAE